MIASRPQYYFVVQLKPIDGVRRVKEVVVQAGSMEDVLQAAHAHGVSVQSVTEFDDISEHLVNAFAADTFQAQTVTEASRKAWGPAEPALNKYRVHLTLTATAHDSVVIEAKSEAEARKKAPGAYFVGPTSPSVWKTQDVSVSHVENEPVSDYDKGAPVTGLTVPTAPSDENCQFFGPNAGQQ